MKKLLLFLALVMTTGLGFAQLTVPFTEDFQGTTGTNLPEGWTYENVNDDWNYWVTRLQDASVSTNREAYANGNFASGIDDWLFTPAITLEVGATYELSFYGRSTGFHSENLKICIGNSNKSEDMTTEILDMKVPNVNYLDEATKVNFSVTSSGDYILGFYATSNPAVGKLYLDNISLKKMVDNDIQVGEIDLPKIVTQDEDINMGVTINNSGTNAATFNLLLTVKDESGEIAETQTKPVSDLAGGNSQKFDFDAFSLPKGNYTLTVKADWAADEDPSDNEKAMTFKVYQGEYMSYDDGEPVHAVNHNSGEFATDFTIAIKYTPEEIQALRLLDIIAIRIYAGPRTTTEKFQIKAWQGEDADYEVFSATVDLKEEGWHEVILSEPVSIDPEEELWIGAPFIIQNTNDFFPAFTDGELNHDGKGNLIRKNKEPWASYSTLNPEAGDWNIQMYATVANPTYNVAFNVVDKNNVAISDAVVTFDGVKNNPGKYTIEDVEVGEYTYLIEKEDYLPVNGTLTVTDQNVDQPITLIKGYTVTIDVLDEQNNKLQDAVVTFDGKDYPANQYIIEEVKPKETEYSFTVTKKSYLPFEGTIIVENQNVSKTVNLEKLYTLTFDVKDIAGGNKLSGAIIKLNGQEYAAGEYVFEDQRKGEYNYEVSLADYQTKTGKVTITNDNVTELVELTGLGIEGSQLADMHIYYNKSTNEVVVNDPSQMMSRLTITNPNGQKVRVSEVGSTRTLSVENLASGVYFVTVETVDGKVLVKKFVK